MPRTAQHSAAGKADGRADGKTGISKDRDLSLFGPGHAVPQPRRAGAIFSPTGVIWVAPRPPPSLPY